jgi:hypothetical protein
MSARKTLNDRVVPLVGITEKRSAAKLIRFVFHNFPLSHAPDFVLLLTPSLVPIQPIKTLLNHGCSVWNVS